MTSTELRLADALDAAARALREDTLRPLLVPQRPRRRAAWLAPAAAAASLLLVVGIAAAVAGHLRGSGNAATPPPRYYVEADAQGDRPVVRSTATGAVTDTVPVPHVSDLLGTYLVAAASKGVFFTAVPAATGVRIYRFRLTPAGQVSTLAAVPGALLGSQLVPETMAASPDGSWVAIALVPTAGSGSSSCSTSGTCSSTYSDQNSYIDVVNTTTGAASVWQGGTGQSYSFSVVNLSWTAHGNELVYYGQWCPQSSSSTQSGSSTPSSSSTQSGSSTPSSSSTQQVTVTQQSTITATVTACATGTGTGAKAEVWALDPAARGGLLTSGRRLFSLSAASPYLPQVLISPDGTTLTAVALTGPVNRVGTPEHLSVEQISVATRKRSGVLYSQDLGSAVVNGGLAYMYPVTLSTDAAGQHWILSSTFCDINDHCRGGLNGWIDSGRLVPLKPGDGSVASEAW